MASITSKIALCQELLDDFVSNKAAFASGNRNDDVVDSMLMCYALRFDWETEVFEPWCIIAAPSEAEKFAIREHYDRVKDWIVGLEARGYMPGDVDVMSFAINH